MKKKIYVTLDSEKRITGYGKAEYGVITIDPKDSILISVPEDHEILTGAMGGYKLVDGDLIKDTSFILNQIKEAKKSELSLACQNRILSGFNHTVKGVDYHLSYDREAQNNYQERWQLFQNNMIESIVVTGHTLDGEDARLTMNKEQFDKLYLSSVMHKENCIKKLRDDLFPLLDSAKTIQDVESVNWNIEVLTPKPETVIIKDDKLLNQEIERLESETALGTNEIMNLMFMLQMQGMF